MWIYGDLGQGFVSAIRRHQSWKIPDKVFQIFSTKDFQKTTYLMNIDGQKQAFGI